jgi:hypothetical protein
VTGVQTCALPIFTRAAADASVAVAVLCGRADVRPEGVPVAALVDRFGEREALERAGPRLESLAEEFAGALRIGASRPIGDVASRR